MEKGILKVDRIEVMKEDRRGKKTKKKISKFKLLSSSGKEVKVSYYDFKGSDSGSRRDDIWYFPIVNMEQMRKIPEGEWEVKYELRGDNVTKLIVILRLAGAVAPYNFVPLKDEVLDAEKPPRFDVFAGYHKSPNQADGTKETPYYNGYIELDITAKSPLFIRGALTEKQVKEKVDSKKIEGHYRPAGLQFKLPGSSIRGMVRSLYEIVSYSKMSMVYDRKLYFRSFADSSLEFRGLYNQYMLGVEKSAWGAPSIVKPGYIKRKGEYFWIYEADGCYRVKEQLAFESKMARNKMKDDGYTEEIKEKPYVKALFKVGLDDKDQEVVTQIKHHSNRPDEKEGYQEGYLILSGRVPKKKKHWVIGTEVSGQKGYKVPKEVIRDYNNDASRGAVNLINPPEKEEKDDKASKGAASTTNKESFRDKTMKLLRTSGVPCFFIVDPDNEDEVLSFGHTPIFRVAYKKGIKSLLPPKHRKSNLLDMAEALFGNVGEGDGKAQPGRVYFEDAIGSSVQEWNEAVYPKILSGPKPNSFQLYLRQDRGKVTVPDGHLNNRNGIDNYDSDGAQLVGRKFYWHKDHNAWIETDTEKRKKYSTQYTKIKPIKEGAKFKARIRFDNLSEVELGALLFVLDLPPECCHKIGMGKPLGLGSIRITPTLTLIDRRERYSSLKNLAEKQVEDLDQYKTAFEDYLRAQVGFSGSAWDSPELKELKTMLDYANRPAHERTRYMEIERKIPGQAKTVNEYKDRKILKKPSEYP